MQNLPISAQRRAAKSQAQSDAALKAALKTITITWTDKRIDAPRYGAVLVACWAGHGDDSELNAALAYAAEQSRKSNNVHRVHTFATDDQQWRNKSAAAHEAGRGL